MSDKRYYKKIKSTIIAGASTGIVAGMLLVGGMNRVYAETPNRVNNVYNYKKISSEHKRNTDIKPYLKKSGSKGWRKNI